jgi:predicted phosphoribosyltransferase
VPVAFEIARELRAPLDVHLVRKIGAPLQPELGVGAISDGDEPQILLDRDRMVLLGIDEANLQDTIRAELAEIRRREHRYRGGRPPAGVRGRTVILVDDGIATGSTARAALRSLRRRGAQKLVLAAPVAPTDTVTALAPEADEIVCLLQPANFRAVGQFYEDFSPVSDEEVVEFLQRGRTPTEGVSRRSIES